MPSSRGWGDGHADICSRASILQRARRKRILHAKHSPTNKEHAELRSKGVRSWRGVHENNVATAQTGARELISKGVRSSQNVAARQPPRRSNIRVVEQARRLWCAKQAIFTSLCNVALVVRRERCVWCQNNSPWCRMQSVLHGG